MKALWLARLVAFASFSLGSLILSTAMAASPGALTFPSAVAYDGGRLQVRVGIQNPHGEVVGDVLYFHGFADRLDNHGPLFDAWNRAGLRVIGFDLPSHGETTGTDNNIDHYSFEDLAHIAALVESKTREDAFRPLILAGWSTGGLIVTRILQQGWLAGYDNRIPTAAILFAPGVSVRLTVGQFGIVTQGTLTRNPAPPHHGSITPLSPAFKPIFAARLLAAAFSSRIDALPANIPVLTLLGDDKEDRYVNSAEIRTWVNDQRHDHHAQISAAQCAGGYHELDNEPAGVGHETRVAAALFARAYAVGDASIYAVPFAACAPF